MESFSGKIEKRNRPPISCEPCRARKSKCDRGLPCDSCKRRSKPSSCQYAANANRNKTNSTKSTNLTSRLKKLEDLVSALASPPNTHSGDGPRGQSSPAPVSSAKGSSPQASHPSVQLSEPSSAANLQIPRTVRSSEGAVSYVDPSHWMSILEDIREVREDLSSMESSITPESSTTKDEGSGNTIDLVFSSIESTSIEEVLAMLPPQPLCDTLLSFYFGSQYMVFGIIHPAKFQSEYESFLNAPREAPVLWIGLLCALLSVSMCLRRISGFGRGSEAPGVSPQTLQEACSKCMKLGNYATANAYVIETLFIHVQSLFFTGMASSTQLWLEFGTLIRLAIRMGYHRDPSHIQSITPFDGEIRRRVWLNIFQVDALVSFQLGFPSMIPSEFCDTEMPRNLEYADLHMDLASLPPPRPLSTQTPILYFVLKGGVMAVFKKIVAHSQSLRQPSYDRTMSLDAEARDVYGKIPQLFQSRDVNKSYMDSSTLIMQRCTIEVLYLKSLIILHRRYMTYDKDITKFGWSRRASVEAALDILDRQADLHDATQPGNRLFEDRWMLTSLTVHDFLLAAMVVCLHLSTQLDRDGGLVITRLDNDNQLLREVRALKASQKFWATDSVFPESAMAAKAVGLMLDKVERYHPHLCAGQSSIAQPPTPITMEFSLSDSMSEMINGTQIVDWQLLDQLFQNNAPDVEGMEFWGLETSWN